MRLFLEYAQQGVKALAATIHGSGESYESPFEQAVAESLQKKGWQVHPQVGVSGFRIDLGIVDPDNLGVYLAGVECDGYTYHRSATARDRDRLRESVLRGLGWDILRIWSTEWWINAESAADKLHMQLEALLKKKRSSRAIEESQNLPYAEPPAHQETILKHYEIAGSSTMLKENTEDTVVAIEQERLRALLQDVVSSYSPIHENVLCAFVAKRLGFSRAGSKVRSSILSMASECYDQSTEDVGVFFWDKGQSPSTCVEFRKRKGDESCVVDEIAMPELIALARTLKVGYGEDPVVLMARSLGLSRLRAVTRPRLETAWALRTVVD